MRRSRDEEAGEVTRKQMSVRLKLGGIERGCEQHTSGTGKGFHGVAAAWEV
jgi:hypothetical protein